MINWGEFRVDVQPVDGKPVDDEHVTIISMLAVGVPMEEVKEKLRTCKRPASIKLRATT